MEDLDQGVVVAGAGEVTSNTASENKRRLGERDAERRRMDLERLRRLDADPGFQREVHAGAAAEPPVQFRHVISAMNDSEEDA